MSRAKNYVNNSNSNRGTFLQAGSKTRSTMKSREWGSGCTRPGCGYRHENNGKGDEICLPFLAGKCTFIESGCRKRHPDKEECQRLIAKYKKTPCRFGDDCYTEGCLYLHPKEIEEQEPYFLEQDHVAFPPLNGSGPSPSTSKPVVNSAWKEPPPSVVPPRSATPSPPPTPPPAAAAPMVVAQPVPPHPMDMNVNMYFHVEMGGIPPEAVYYHHQQYHVGPPPPPPPLMSLPPPEFFAAPYYGMPMEMYPDMYYEHGMMMMPPPIYDQKIAFNANAKEFIPTNAMAS